MSEPASLGSIVDGKRIDSGADRLINLINPANGAIAGSIEAAGQSAVDAAVASSRAALQGPWGALPPVVRGGMLKALAGLIEANADSMVGVRLSLSRSSL